MRRVLRGIAVTRGAVCGPLVCWDDRGGRTSGGSGRGSAGADPEDSKRLWSDAKAATMQLLEELEEKTSRDAGPEAAQIFCAHRMILEDPLLDRMVLERLAGGTTLAQAISDATGALAAQFEALENEYMRERAADVRDIGRRLVDALPGSPRRGVPTLKEPSVLAARDLAPSQAAALDKRLLLGIVLEGGSRTSHTAILARALDIPAVVAVKRLFEPDEPGASGGRPYESGERSGDQGGNTGGLSEGLCSGETILVDADTGTVIIDPSGDDLDKYSGRLRVRGEGSLLEPGPALGANPLGVPAGAPVSRETVTADGARVRIAGNVGSLDDLAVLRKYGLSEIGLCRTEFLFLESGRVPGEEEQLAVYRQIADAVRPGAVVFRTLDAGGDKDIPGLAMPRETNPSLGLRGLRLCLANRELFKTQIRALLRASVFGNVKVMFPMVATLEEYREAMEIVREARKELADAGVQVPAGTKWGIMVEVPAAAVIADRFAEEVDFFSIGTNDLIQYTVAVDRLNENVSHLYQPFHPAVLRLIRHVIEAGHKHGREVGMCGEMAGMPEAAPILLGMGLDVFSVSPPAAPAVREALKRVTCDEARRLAEQAAR